jgi:hypothetical protein
MSGASQTAALAIQRDVAGSSYLEKTSSMHHLHGFGEGLEPSQTFLPCPRPVLSGSCEGQRGQAPFPAESLGRSGPTLLGVVNSGSYTDQSGPGYLLVRVRPKSSWTDRRMPWRNWIRLDQPAN